MYYALRCSSRAVCSTACTLFSTQKSINSLALLTPCPKLYRAGKNVMSVIRHGKI